MSDFRDYKTTVTRPFHVQSRLPSDEYRDGWDRIWGGKRVEVEPTLPMAVEHKQALEKGWSGLADMEPGEVRQMPPEVAEAVRAILRGKGKGKG